MNDTAPSCSQSKQISMTKKQHRMRKREGRSGRLTAATTALLLAMATLQTDAFTATTATGGSSLSSRLPLHVGNTHHTTASSSSLKTSSLQMTSSTTLASNEDDKELILQIKNNGSTTARNKLLTKHMGLVYHTVNTILCRRSRKSLLSLTRHDLEQEGFLGLNRAVDSYEFDRGATFSTYAVYWIRAYVHRAIAKEDNLIRIPEYVTANLRKLHGVAYQLQMDLDLLYNCIVGKEEDIGTRESSSAEKVGKDGMTKEEMWSILQSETGLTDKQIKECLRVREWRKHGGYTHLQPWMHQQDKMELSSSLLQQEDLGGTNPEDLKKMLAQFLRPKEVEAISWRYGLNADEAVTPSKARDYEAEAENDLFGPGGVLSSSIPISPSTTTLQRGTQTTSARKAATAVTTKSHLPKRGKWGEDMSFAEIGTRMAVSAEYTRRLTKAALEKLRRAVEEGRLEPDFLV